MLIQFFAQKFTNGYQSNFRKYKQQIKLIQFKKKEAKKKTKTFYIFHTQTKTKTHTGKQEIKIKSQTKNTKIFPFSRTMQTKNTKPKNM